MTTTPAADVDDPVTDDEIRAWLSADQTLLMLRRSARRRYLAADESDRPAIAHEHGFRNLTDLDITIGRLRDQVARYERHLATTAAAAVDIDPPIEAEPPIEAIETIEAVVQLTLFT